MANDWLLKVTFITYVAPPCGKEQSLQLAPVHVPYIADTEGTTQSEHWVQAKTLGQDLTGSHISPPALDQCNTSLKSSV